MAAEDAYEVTGATLDAARAALVGRTIVGFDREDDTDEAWPQSANSVTLHLDDGTTVDFVGYGYDASGLNMWINLPAGKGDDRG